MYAKISPLAWLLEGLMLRRAGQVELRAASLLEHEAEVEIQSTSETHHWHKGRVEVAQFPHSVPSQSYRKKLAELLAYEFPLYRTCTAVFTLAAVPGAVQVIAVLFKRTAGTMVVLKSEKEQLKVPV